MTVEIPQGITEQEAKEWLAILHERKINKEVNDNPVVKAVAQKAQEDIDAYRKAVGLAPKFAKVEEMTNEEAQTLVDKGEAVIPEEAVIEPPKEV